MYDRRLGKRVLAFGHEGVLYKNSFIMYDRATNSKWVHTTGEAVKGPLKGSFLKFLPSTVTSWKAWRSEHPTTTALLGRKARGFMGAYNATRQATRYGLSLGSGLTTRLYLYRKLASRPLINDTFGKSPVLVVYDAATATARAFEARLGKRRLTFSSMKTRDAKGRLQMKDRASGSLWLMMRGECVEGPDKGKLLEQLPATPWLVTRWRGFYPKGDVYSSSRR